MSIFKVKEDSVQELLDNEIGYCPGWHELLTHTFDKILYLCGLFNIDEINVGQIKEKFGTLRMYISYSPTNYDVTLCKLQLEILHDIESAAEKRSAMICQNSGKYGTIRDVCGWYATLSDEEYEKELKKRK